MNKPLTARQLLSQRKSICLAMAKKDFCKAHHAWGADWQQYWSQHSWNYLLVWAALKQGIDV